MVDRSNDNLQDPAQLNLGVVVANLHAVRSEGGRAQRDLIRTGAAERRSRAKAQGQQMGRLQTLIPAQQTACRRCEPAGLLSRQHERAALWRLARAGISRGKTAPRASG
jgi:hypothetical protein